MLNAVKLTLLNQTVMFVVHNFLFIHFYPRVKVKGCQIVVPQKPEEKPDVEAPEAPKAPFDWNTFATTLSAGILSFATIYVLLQRGN